MTATLTRTLGRFVWRELHTRDVAAAKRFYRALFGWRAEDVPMGPDWSYTLLYLGDKQVGGMNDIANLPDGGVGVPEHWTVYVSVADVDAAAELAISEGARQVAPCMDIPNVGRFAAIQDPQGAHINLFRSTTGDPHDTPPVPGEFCWENLSTSDPASALAFYQKVVGWGVTPFGQDVSLLTRAGGEVATVGQAPDGSPSAWLPFVGVESVSASLEQAAQLGATTHVGVTDIPGVGAFAILEDPTGAVFALFESQPA